MINWDEPNFDMNYEHACSVLGVEIKLVSGIKGIHAAHAHCALNSSSDFFWCIDGDNWLYETAKADMKSIEIDATDLESVYVMRAKNPFNGLVYGHGAIKLLPRSSFIKNLNLASVDMTSGANLHYRIIHKLTSEHRYNGSAFHAWRTAFRECVKLSSSIIPNSKQDETVRRLTTWCDRSSLMKVNFWEEHINGAVLGAEYGNRHSGDVEILHKINDFSWLRQEFEKR
jgi:glycosyltransferase involved in cell wall biosynthesis